MIGRPRSTIPDGWCLWIKPDKQRCGMPCGFTLDKDGKRKFLSHCDAHAPLTNHEVRPR